ncbi:MAG: PHP-associated domain-containing protein [Candidatus Hydrogenedens sp.]
MRLKFDIHLHTNVYSPCSLMEPEEMVESAISTGLDGIVITEHHYQWTEKEIEELKKKVFVNGLTIFSGAEITTDAGDLLVFGLKEKTISQWKSFVSVEEVIAEVKRHDGFCIAAHPTRDYHHFDYRLETLPIPAMEVMSVNMNVAEQEKASLWANKLNRVQICASDAHRAIYVGRYWIEVEMEKPDKIDFISALKNKRFRMGSPNKTIKNYL